MTQSIKALMRLLSDHADPDYAPKMQADMKSEMPFLGIRAPQLRQLCKAFYAECTFADFSAWCDFVLPLWRDAEYREERHAALELCGHKVSKPFQTLEVLPIYEEFVVTGAWWDYIDWIAAQRLGALLKTYPVDMAAEMRRWSLSDDMWKRRSAILCQLKSKADTDFGLLHDCMAPAMSSKEFFLRKAIGWALRTYARIEPELVLDYVRQYDAELSPLSKREALKHLK
ncbi:MAG: DNA alkylation repair protein [Pseudomonadota bacterium]